jgi:hypothetical protein
VGSELTRKRKYFLQVFAADQIRSPPAPRWLISLTTKSCTHSQIFSLFDLADQGCNSWSKITLLSRMHQSWTPSSASGPRRASLSTLSLRPSIIHVLQAGLLLHIDGKLHLLSLASWFPFPCDRTLPSPPCGGTFWFMHAVPSNKELDYSSLLMHERANWKNKSLISNLFCFFFPFSVEAEIGRRECPTAVPHQTQLYLCLSCVTVLLLHDGLNIILRFILPSVLVIATPDSRILKQIVSHFHKQLLDTRVLEE